MVHAIILAGGRSSRLPGDTVKQFRKVNNDKMLITYSLESFIRCDKLDKITVVIEDEAWEELILADIPKCERQWKSLPLAIEFVYHPDSE